MPLGREKIVHESAGLLVVKKKRGETGEILIAYCSPVLSEEGGLFQHVRGMLRGKCHSLGVSLPPVINEEMYGGRHIERIYKIFDSCPSGIEHNCVKAGI